MEFSLIEGKRKCSWNYIAEGYRYTKNRENNGIIYLKCTLAKQCACNSLARVDARTNLLEVTRGHNHSQAEYKSDSIVLANRIKRSAVSSTDTLREIFDDECRGSSAGSSLTFRKLESTMYKRRKLEVPNIPLSPEEFVEQLIVYSYTNTYRFSIANDNGTAVVFATELMLSKLRESDSIHFDATFKVVPRLFYQLMTIFIPFKGHTIPAIHILMTSKNEQLYKAVLLSLKDILPNFNPSTAMCDFEKSSRNAFRSVYPSINLIGCWFHFTKAIYDKIKKFALCKLYKHNKAFKKWIYQIMSLPFLPEEEIRPTYSTLSLSLLGLTTAELELVSSFKKYFVKTWLDGSENLSVFYYEFSTNNGAESYHNKV